MIETILNFMHSITGPEYVGFGICTSIVAAILMYVISEHSVDYEGPEQGRHFSIYFGSIAIGFLWPVIIALGIGVGTCMLIHKLITTVAKFFRND